MVFSRLILFIKKNESWEKLEFLFIIEVTKRKEMISENKIITELKKKVMKKNKCRSKEINKNLKMIGTTKKNE